ncbi:uncharacterized protein J3D65DRAFT_24004 [Phyllosticta citribraziliensis]|uniref:Uncharacterized protein n=1 Tax=Phyllosticta citribraziliensis TaxID=989973 RepID=A0ABR1M9I0_9PEZI
MFATHLFPFLFYRCRSRGVDARRVRARARRNKQWAGASLATCTCTSAASEHPPHTPPHLDLMSTDAVRVDVQSSFVRLLEPRIESCLLAPCLRHAAACPADRVHGHRLVAYSSCSLAYEIIAAQYKLSWISRHTQLSNILLCSRTDTSNSWPRRRLVGYMQPAIPVSHSPVVQPNSTQTIESRSTDRHTCNCLVKNQIKMSNPRAIDFGSLWPWCG